MQANEKYNKSLALGVRQITNGDWYWIHKVVIQNYATRIGAFALNVYHLLASMVNKKQRCFPSQKYIAERLGCSRNTVNRAIRKLEDNHLIAIEKRDRYRCIYVLLNVRCASNEPQMSTGSTSDVAMGDTNNTKGKRINNDTLRVNKKLTFTSPESPTKEELLATDIAHTLGEENNIKTYLSYANKYPESFLRRMLSEVKRTPSHKIKKSRGALFAYLVRHYADNHS